MPERQPHKSGLSPSPFQFGILLLVIGLATLGAGLILSGAFGALLPESSSIKQAQAIESPTSETTEPAVETPTVEITATLEITPTLSETVTIIAEPTVTETHAVTPPASETPLVEPTTEPSATIVTAIPTQIEIPPTENPAAVVSLTPEPSATQESPTSVPANEDGSIVYNSTDGELFAQRVNKRGKPIGQPTQVDLSALPGSLVEAQVSPNGKDVLLDFAHAGPGCNDCEGGVPGYAILSLPSGKIEIIEPPTIWVYGWHPDGKHLLFRGLGGDVCLFDIHAKKCRTVANVNAWLGADLQPSIDGIAFSPDGEQLIIAFDVPGQGLYQTWIANSDGSNARKVMEGEGPFFSIAWSPNGSHIAFINDGLEVLDSNGENRRTLSRNFSVGWGFLPRWSPDSQMLAFEAYEELPTYPGYQEGVEKAFQHHKMHLVDLATLTERRIISDEAGGDIQGAWSPDSKRMVVLSNRNGNTELWLVNLQNGQLEQISADGKFKRTKVEWLKKPLGE